MGPPSSICERLFEVSTEVRASLCCRMELLISLCGCRKGSALIPLLSHLILQVNILACYLFNANERRA